LGERLLCKQEVVGSIPSGSTRRFGLAAPSDHVRDRAELPAVIAGEHAANKQLLVRNNAIRRASGFGPYGLCWWCACYLTS
jgi:hypothetical protein